MSDAADFPALGFDPAPGNPGNVDALVTRLNTAASALSSAHQSLSSLTRTGGAWQGDAATAFAGKVGELPSMLRDSDDAIRTAARQLDAWHGQLLSYQATARKYESEAQAAKQRCEQCEAAKDRARTRYNSAADAPAFRLAGQVYTDDAALQDAQNRIDTAQRELTRAGDELDGAKRALDDAKDAFEAIVKQAKELKEDHQDSAAKIAKALRKANQNAPETSMWDRFKDSLKRAGHAIKEWATKHADLLKKIGDWMGVASTVLGVLALCTLWFPPLSGALALAGGVMSAGALATHGLAKLGGAKVSAMDLIGDGLGVVPFGKFAGVAMKGSAKVVTKVGAEVIENGQKVTRAVDVIDGVNGAARIADKAGDAVHALPRISRIGGEAVQDGVDFVAKPGIGNRVALAWEKHVADNMASSFKEKRLSDIVTRTPGLRSLPGLQAAIRADGSLDPLSWWSRGPQVVGSGVGIINSVGTLLSGE
ncbi:putative T7SS-secreted protein [Kitasatospora sp. NPDC051853]|uniref:WXG100 family type VII secretion target n=1 Tax=Kitasatospora sp. NPDC051853 TaxID=3364058 RepID=UPI0037A6EC5D